MAFEDAVAGVASAKAAGESVGWGVVAPESLCGRVGRMAGRTAWCPYQLLWMGFSSLRTGMTVVAIPDPRLERSHYSEAHIIIDAIGMYTPAVHK